MQQIWFGLGTRFRLDQIIENPGQRVLYYLSCDKAPQRAFFKEEVMLIPEDTEVPPDQDEF